MSVSIKVAVRCRPFTADDKLGIILSQHEDEQGEVTLINCDYSTKRFPFTYCWWSAYGYQRHLKGDNMPNADDMKLIDQDLAYGACGLKIKSDLLSGSAVVLFAYGLSGSGKTFTVFGPDAVDAPEAWFKHAEPHGLWGILPRLAYEIFRDKQPLWKIKMKYFQNVVDIVRDLLSNTCEEQHYKNGMKKDEDGFMDCVWCAVQPVTTWDEFRKVFQVANGRKAIAPTQFNPMSTRGHCIMTLELEMPHPEMEGMKQRGRLYVCDLAGTEPAGDIVYATYEKKFFDDGSFEYKFKGAHTDKAKTKELQDQGKKINLSLSEMAQFFMKMAEAVLAKKLKPGMTIPGCNSFFLCKYLKDTMLQARTYLFCAIRPEVQFLKYTFATLGFAKNASVVKLSPKKATVACSPQERKLMAELDAMKALVEQLKSAAPPPGAGGMDESAQKTIEELQAKLAAKSEDYNHEGSEVDHNAEMAERQKEEYGRRGIHLTIFESDTEKPYFINLDEDAFRSNRLMYIIDKEVTTFGSKCDIQLMSFAVIKNHCSVKFDGQKVVIVGGKGDTFLNGKKLDENDEKEVQLYDRVAMGDQLMLFRWKQFEKEGDNMMSAEDAVEEFQEGMMAARAGGGSSDIDEERRKIMEERTKWEQEKNELSSKRDEEEFQRAMASVDNSILDLLPKAKEAKQTVDLLNRTTMTFDVVLEKGADHVPKVKISVENQNPKLSILIDPNDFLPKLSLLKDEMMKLRYAIDGNREYNLPERHDPLFLMFDNDFLLGTATHWPEYLLYNLETDAEELQQEIKNAAVPYNTVGLLKVEWKPLTEIEIEEEKELIGKPWKYELNIEQASDLPVFCEQCYVEYEFFGETFTTEVIEANSFSPALNYKFVHEVPHCTQEFIDFLKGSIEMHVHVTQAVEQPKDVLGTDNPIVVESIKTGVPKGYENSENGTASAPGGGSQVQELKTKLESALSENASLKKKIEELEVKLSNYESSTTSKTAQRLEDAKLTDSVVN